MKRSEPTPSSRLLPRTSLLALLAVAACSGSGSSVGETRTGGDFLVLKTEPVNGATIFLNDPISIDFNEDVDLESANLTTMTFLALDQNGLPTSDLVTGSFSIGRSTGDLEAGRRLNFVPRFPTNDDFTDGGFKAGRTYLVQLVGGQANNGNVLRNKTGKALENPITFRFSTRDGTQPQQLFRNPRSGGPARSGLSVSTASDLDAVPLGLFGAPPLEVRLDFDQALNPGQNNVPSALDIDPLVRDQSLRGRIFLEYDDPEFGANTWIPATVELERNDLLGATVVLRPAGVLPNNATIRVIVERTLEDIAGENNTSNPTYNRVFGSFKTTSGFEQQWNCIAEDFRSGSTIDPAAAFPEAQAEVGPGFVKAGFAFEGTPTTLEYEPTANEVVLNTDFTQVVPKTGLPFTVNGGVFNFRNVTIPQGVTVVGQGSNPMVWLCSGTFTVSGTLSVRGGNGARVDTLESANFAKAGGVGRCGGGNGGEGTPSATQRDPRGGTGRGPMQEPGRGGRGGFLACQGGCYTGDGYDSSGGGSGGGGGTMATQGDPWWRGTLPAVTNPNVANQTAFQQRFGYGGAGCSGVSDGEGAGRTAFLPGGDPGDLVFIDSRQDNNFWGSAIDINRNLRITGELANPVGGGGGGGGGDTSDPANCSLTAANFATDYSGGGGGGGGGVLIVKALQEITVTATGKIIADGGHGGGGEQVGACGEAGGGGGGAGGMVILMSAKSIIIEAHGDEGVGPQGRFVYGAPTAQSTASHPFLRDDYNFAISADGGVCTTGGFGAINIQGKYRNNGTAMFTGVQYDTEPTGGLGGMGIVQLMAPPGDNSGDGTNTRLDDNIIFRLPGSSTDLEGAAKRQLIGWRGFPNQNGLLVDDFDNQINLGDNEGDIRPSPTLMPVPFNAKSRVRSRWIDTGATVRRELGAPDNGARGLVTAAGAMPGPIFEFAGTFGPEDEATMPDPDGYVRYRNTSGAVQLVTPQAFPADTGPAIETIAVASTDGTSSYLGSPAYRVTLASAALAEANRYVGYYAELRDAGDNVRGGFRILQHDSTELTLSPGFSTLPADVTKLRILAKFFDIQTNGSPSLGATYAAVGGPPIPNSNVRIGFAVHIDPDADDIEDGRFPLDAQEFLYDFNDPGLLAWLAANEASGLPRPRYIQWDVLFDMAYKPTGATPPALSASTPRPELHFLNVPFRF